MVAVVAVILVVQQVAIIPRYILVMTQRFDKKITRNEPSKKPDFRVTGQTIRRHGPRRIQRMVSLWATINTHGSHDNYLIISLYL